MLETTAKQSLWAGIVAKVEAKLYKSKSRVVKYRREQLSNRLDAQLNGVVAYGPFKGLKLARSSSWAQTDKASMLLGFYEQELLNEIATLPARYRVFIDLGAADGYYGVGALINNRFDKSYCFEITELGQKVIRETAERNGVSDRITVLGKADKDFAKQVDADLDQAVLFVDIEGAEFNIFDRDVFAAFKHSVIFMELHEWLVEDGDEKLRKLREDASEYFHIKDITTGARDLSVYPELHYFNDTDRWLLCSEGRARLMRWLRLDPKI